MESYDIIVIGGGPGGYVAALRAAKSGASVALVEGDHLGGTCLNRGCIPSKTLLRHSEFLEQMEKARGWGIETGPVSINFERMLARKDTVIHTLRKGIAGLIKAGKIKHYQGFGHVRQDLTVRIDLFKDEQEVYIRGNDIIVATGSKPAVPPIKGIEEAGVHSTDTIFNVQELPESVFIMGAGFIGVEFACIYSALGVEVTLAEMADRLLPLEDVDAARMLSQSLKKKGVQILTKTKVEELKRTTQGTTVQYEDAKGNTGHWNGDLVLAATGRKPNLKGLEELSLEMDGPFVAVDEYMQTSIPHIFAVGDVIGGWQLAHSASAEGLVAVANVLGHETKWGQQIVPRCVYTAPEIASVGISEEQAKSEGYDVKVQKIQMGGNGKALAMDERMGFVKLIAEQKYGQILGVVMVGPHVTEMIAEAVAIIELEGTVEELSRMVHPHPTLSENLFEAAEAWLGQGIHH
ncbi:dihydrolipoyl dehydrogenase [Salipaludibacillus keqinensis]|uniref:Dihydrolipoyl dehydrogenase n=1 Tax=Salipaludibacillus keqinensis TaxID=2045207 RepID=A0A323TD22_9BACI|nr:dihydrolipoyl dehydrogenase [Salipaludibacillus keqinensis]PYZ93001.1 dihydrolipoyl dehydrogenase [Salipaludibacillus keqinensis]